MCRSRYPDTVIIITINMDFVQGEILCFDKPYQWTSFDMVNKVRWLICRHLGVKKLKVGHAGTLDPLATGVLIICTGKATKKIEDFLYMTKEYIATLRFGATTLSFDLEKPINAIYPIEHITRERVEKVLSRFIGTIQQTPPQFSACKVDGKRAYKMARKGKTVELKPKTLVIDKIELIKYDMPDITIRVVCSKGTYIRALARDIGEALESGAHLTDLRRVKIGEIDVEDCFSFESFKNNFSDSISNSLREKKHIASYKNDSNLTQI